jgi:hypothetical protein
MPLTDEATRSEELIKGSVDLESITAEIQALVVMIRRIDGYDEKKTTVPAQAAVP